MTGGILFAAGLLLPVGLRLWQRRSRRSTHPVVQPGVNVVVALSAAPWVLLAWRIGHPGPGAGDPDWARLIWMLVLGLAWVEAVLLLWRPFRSAPPAAVTVPAVPEADPHRPTHPDADEVLDEAVPAEEPLTAEAERLLGHIHALSRVTVEKIMTPRSEVVSVDARASVRDVLSRMRETRHMRVVVTEGSLDRILGIAHAKDLARSVLRGEADRPARKHLRRWLRVPAGRSVSRLLEDFRRNRLHIGIVGDVRGRTLGMVTLSDIVEHVSRFDGDGDGVSTGSE